MPLCKRIGKAIKGSLAAAKAVLTIFVVTVGLLQHDSVTLRSDDDSSVEDKHECIGVMRSFLAGRISDPVAHGEII